MNNNINQDGKYFNVHIENNQYYITRSTQKQGKDSAITNLKNIEEILSKNLKYAPDHADQYAKMPDGDRFKLLKNESDQIVKNYKDTVNSNIFYRIFNHEKEIKVLHENIRSIINPAEKKTGPIGDVIQKEFMKYLPASDLISLSLVNKAATGLTDVLVKNLATELGFIEKESTITAKEYLKDLFDELDMLHKEKLIPEQLIIYLNKEKGTIDAKQTLLKFKKLSDRSFIILFCTGATGSITNVRLPFLEKADKILNFLDVKRKVLDLSKSEDDILLKAEKTLYYAAKNNKKEIIELLLRSGVDPDLRNTFHPLNFTDARPLELAVSQDNFEIAKLLLRNGADYSSALKSAAKSDNYPMVKLILENGIKGDVNSLNPLIEHFSRRMYQELQPPSLKMVELLLKHGANPDIADPLGRKPIDLMSPSESLFFTHDGPSVRRLLDRYGTKYFDVHIEDGQFYITQSSLKPKNGLALSALESIKKVLEQGLVYNPDHKDNSPRLNPNLTNEEALALLNQKADEIARKYKNAVANSSLPKNLTNEKKVRETYVKIKQLIQEKNLQ